MVVMARRLVLGLLSATAVSCGAPDPPAPTGGVDVDATECGRGLVVVSTDYQSTNVALTDREGQVLSSSIISSGSATTGLSAPLGGDVVPPTMATSGEHLVLVDRFPAAVLTWVEIESGQVMAQLPVGTGFASNPQDYLELSPERALLSRFERNPNPGDEAFDGGSDILVIDPTSVAITKRIALEGAMDGLDSSFLPRPGRMLATEEHVYVLLSVYSASFEPGPSRLAVLSRSDLSLEHVVELGGLQGCVGLALSPSGGRVGVSCSGAFDGTSEPDLEHSGIAVVVLDGDARLEHVERASELSKRPPAFSLAFATDDVLLVPTFGQLNGAGDSANGDELLSWNPATQDFVELATGEAFSFGEVRCSGRCGVCFMTDASGAGALRRFYFDPDSGELTGEAALVLESEVGLPPRYLGGY